MTRTVRLTLGDQTIELPVTEGTEGELALDVSSLRAKTGLITFDPGFGATAFCKSAITYSTAKTASYGTAASRSSSLPNSQASSKLGSCSSTAACLHVGN